MELPLKNGKEIFPIKNRGTKNIVIMTINKLLEIDKSLEAGLMEKSCRYFACLSLAIFRCSPYCFSRKRKEILSNYMLNNIAAKITEKVFGDEFRGYEANKPEDYDNKMGYYMDLVKTHHPKLFEKPMHKIITLTMEDVRKELPKILRKSR